MSKKTVARLSQNTNAGLSSGVGSDTSSFASKQMAKMGWKAGVGLGKNGQGMADAISVTKKTSDSGVGFADQSAGSAVGGDGKNSAKTAIQIVPAPGAKTIIQTSP